MIYLKLNDMNKIIQVTSKKYKLKEKYLNLNLNIK